MTVARRVSRPIGTKPVPYPMATTSEPTAGPAPMSQAPVAKPATNQASPTPTTATARVATTEAMVVERAMAHLGIGLRARDDMACERRSYPSAPVALTMAITGRD